MNDHGSIERSVLADQVKDRLLQDILAGRYPPDSRIVETRVARELGTSQAPVREALRGLEALGVVDILPFRGARVRQPTLAELVEAYAVRAELECLGARLAVPRLEEADLEGFERLMGGMEAAAALGDRHEVAVLDAAFHRQLIGRADNATLTRVWASLEPFSRTYITLVGPNTDALWTAGLHRPIMAALRARDTAGVERELRDHFERVSSRLSSNWVEPAARP